MSNIKQLIQNQSLEKFAENATRIYGLEVLENRAVPDFRDGLKPVHRAILWAMYKLNLKYNGPYKKCAKIVGDVIGAYSPHGDMATYDALVNIANAPTSMIDGYGNFGSHVESAGAYRYTEARLSKFSDLYLLDPEYIAVMPMQKNFSEDQEFPVVLPAKVPNVLLIDNTSIAVGIAAGSPPFELRGVIELTKLALEGKTITSALCYKHLKFNFKYGGKCVSSKEDVLEYFTTGNKSLQFEPEYIEDVKRRTFTITSTCPGLSSDNTLKTLFKKVSDIPGVKLVYDAEDSNGIKYVIEFGKVGEEKVTEGFAAIRKLLVKSQKYDFGVIERVDKTQFFRTNVIDVITKWCVWRVGVEKKVIENRIARTEANIARYELLLLAVSSISVIMESLRKENSEAYLMKALGITAQQADYIMELKIKQLKRMEKNSITLKLKSEKELLKKYKLDYKNPKSCILEELNSIKI